VQVHGSPRDTELAKQWPQGYRVVRTLSAPAGRGRISKGRPAARHGPAPVIKSPSICR